MIIDCISDLHGYYPELEGGDLLIIAGDITARDEIIQWGQFFHWLKKQPYEKKIIIAGNHDNFLYSGFPKTQEEADDLKEVLSFLIEQGEMGNPDFEYLCDSGTQFEGFKVWGSPCSLKFEGINPHCMAFTGTEEELAEKFALIPDNIDILITHSPPYGILDQVRIRKLSGRRMEKEHVGSQSLRNQVINGRFPNLKLHIFGHIHECGGKILDTTLTKFVNASIVNEYYENVNKPIRIQL